MGRSTIFNYGRNEVRSFEPALWEGDANPAGFHFVDADNANNNLVAFFRSAPNGTARGIICVCIFARVVRNDYRMAVPSPGLYQELLHSDSIFGGSNIGNGGAVAADAIPSHGFGYSLVLRLPALAALWLAVP